MSDFLDSHPDFDPDAEEPMAMTGKGWPRPWMSGFPIPWVSHPATLGQLEPQRIQECVRDDLCPICGLGHEPGSRPVFFVKSAQEPDNLEDMAIAAMDQNLVHVNCAKLSIKHCPMLDKLREAGELMIYRAPIEDFYVLEDPDDPDGGDMVCVNGAVATRGIR